MVDSNNQESTPSSSNPKEPKTAAREYVSLSGVGDLQLCRQILSDITTEMRNSFDSQKVTRRASFFVRLLLNEHDVEEENLSLDDIINHSKGVFPIVWVKFTFDPEKVDQQEIQQLEQKFSLQLIALFEDNTQFR